MKKLGRCPFCGSDSVRVQRRIARHLSSVVCMSCRASGPVLMSEREAVKYWQYVSRVAEMFELGSPLEAQHE